MRKKRRTRRTALPFSAVLVLLLVLSSCWRHSTDPMARLRRVDPAGHVPVPTSNRLVYSGTAGVAALGAYTTTVFDDVNRFWSSAFNRAGVRYRTVEKISVPTGLITDSNCGTASYAAGAFYCPGRVKGGPIHRTDRVYAADDWMYREIDQPSADYGGIAVALVLAHAVSRHVQDSAGMPLTAGSHGCCHLTADGVELHADCLSGVWAHFTYLPDAVGADDVARVFEAERRATDSTQLDPAAHASDAPNGARVDSFMAGFQTGSTRRCEDVARRASASAP